MSFFTLLAFLLSPFLPLFADISIATFQGKAISSHSEEIINLVDQIYREYPYQYAGDDAEYRAYLESFLQSDDAIIALSFDGDKVIGLAAGIPMAQTRDIYKQTLIDHGFDIKRLFYIGEFGLEPSKQSEELFEAMYQKIEDFAKKSGDFTALCIWELERSQPGPSGYLPSNDFWRKNGFILHPELNFNLFWKNIGSTVESPHVAIYSIKEL